jgi:hypothetical protein
MQFRDEDLSMQFPFYSADYRISAGFCIKKKKMQGHSRPENATRLEFALETLEEGR